MNGIILKKTFFKTPKNIWDDKTEDTFIYQVFANNVEGH